MLFNAQTQDRVGNALSENLGGSMRANSALELSASGFRNPLQQSDRMLGATSSASISTSPPSTFADLAGNDLTHARSIAVGADPGRFSDWIGSTDTNDYYRFTLAANSNFNASLTRLSNDVDIQLLNSSGGIVASSARGGNYDESITQSALVAGTYYLRVFQYSGDTLYTLNLSSSTPSNLLPVENTLGTSGSTSGVINNTNTSDTMRLSLTANSRLNVSLTGLSADIDLRVIRDANSNGIMDAGEEIARSTKSSNSDESINLSGLAAGSYFVQAYQYSNNSSSYNLRFSTGGAFDPSTLLTTETNVGSLSGTRTFSDAVSNSDTADVYRFSLGSYSSGFNITLSGLTSDADIRLINDINNNGFFDSGEEIARSASGGNYAEMIRTPLNAGNYFVQVYQYSGSTNYNLTLSTGDWFSSNLSDAGIIGEARIGFTDGQLNRLDMIRVLRGAEDGSSIDSTELTDLRRITANASSFAMPDYARVLSNKIVNGDPANTRSGGSNIGNLFAGSSDTQMERLIGKWFLGNDRPAASGTYQSVSGSLFQNGTSDNDIVQGGVGDCYFMSTLASAARERPTVIQNMFIDNGDGTFTVRFFNNGVADYVTVDRFLPTNGGSAVYAGWGGGLSTSSSNELWAALAEKAYAQINESGWIGRDNTNTYAGLNGGWMDVVMRQIAGLATTSNAIASMTRQQLIDLSNSNRLLTAGFVSGTDFGVVNNHAYAITSYNATNGTFHLDNPWGSSDADVTWDQLVSINAVIQYTNT